MAKLLVRRFVRDYDNAEDIRVRTAYGILTSMVGIGCNLLLFVSKLCTSIPAHSISVMAGASNNSSDVASSIIGSVGVKMAGKPADDDHPPGHGRIECVVAFIVALLVIQVGLSLFKTSLGKVPHPEDVSFRWVSIPVLLVSAGIKLWPSCFNGELGKRTDSKVMLATSADALGGATTASATICSIGIHGALGLNVDGIVRSIVSVVVMIAGVNIAKDTLAPLIGEVIDPEVYGKIISLVEGFNGIVGNHDLIVHSYGPSQSMASTHAEMPDDCDVERTHEIIDHTERGAMRRMGILLAAHMDPMGIHDERAVEFRELVTSALDSIDNRLMFHDFKMVDGTERIGLIFDLVVSREYKPSVLGKLKARITEDAAKEDRRCCCVTTMENSFISGSRE